MNSKIFMVTVRWLDPTKTDVNVENIQKQLNVISGGISWIRFTQFLWLIKTNPFVTSDQVTNSINRTIAGLEQILVFEVDRKTRSGWCPEWVWNWINNDL